MCRLAKRLLNAEGLKLKITEDNVEEIFVSRGFICEGKRLSGTRYEWKFSLVNIEFSVTPFGPAEGVSTFSIGTVSIFFDDLEIFDDCIVLTKQSTLVAIQHYGE